MGRVLALHKGDPSGILSTTYGSPSLTKRNPLHRNQDEVLSTTMFVNPLPSPFPKYPKVNNAKEPED